MDRTSADRPGQIGSGRNGHSANTSGAARSDGPVRTPGPVLIAYDGFAPSAEAIVTAADTVARDVVEHIADYGARVATHAGLTAHPLAMRAEGTVAETILQVADNLDAAVIVLGAHGHDGLRGTDLGRVAHHVVYPQRPTCPRGRVSGRRAHPPSHQRPHRPRPRRRTTDRGRCPHHRRRRARGPRAHRAVLTPPHPGGSCPVRPLGGFRS